MVEGEVSEDGLWVFYDVELGFVLWFVIEWLMLECFWFDVEWFEVWWLFWMSVVEWSVVVDGVFFLKDIGIEVG